MFEASAQALEQAAKVAEDAGDQVHAESLRERAKIARRRQRERDAGIHRPAWNFPASWYR